MKKKISVVLALIIFLINILPVSAQEVSLSLESEAVILIEEETGKILYEKNSNKKMYPASTTKILTSLIAMEYFEDNEVIHIGNEVYSVPLDASKAGHNPGDEITFKDLLISLLLPSGNDSAFVIASQVAKKITSDENLDINGSIAHFSILMNEKAKEFGLNNTHFVNPHGYHDDNHYTTAYDLGFLTREAFKNPLFKEIVSMPSANIGSESNEKQQQLSFKNRNLLLDSKNSDTYYPYATGVKTGFTNEAGQCLVASATKDGMSLIAVILNNPSSDGRWNDAKTLFEYGYQNYKYQNVVNKGETITTVDVEKVAPKGPSQLEIVAKEDYKDLFNNADIARVQKSITLYDDPIIAPITEGQVVGEISFSLDDEELEVIKLAAKYAIEKRTVWDVMFSINAIPYWGGGIAGILLFILVIHAIKKKRRKRGFHFR